MSDFQFNNTITDPAVLRETFFREYPDYTDNDADLIKSGWDFLCAAAGTKRRADGEPYILHPMRVACILAENKLDAPGICAGFLHNIFTLENVDASAVEKNFSPEIINIIRASHRITGLNMHSKTLEQADSFRKMLFAMTDDIRVILVKMADRLDRIRGIAALQSDEQKQLSAEIIEIWAPLANRLGMSAVKIEMEDLSLKYSNPDVFAQLKRIVALKKSERTEYLEKAQKEIYKAAARSGIEVSVYGRAKHFYSIYQKMKKKNRTAEELLDLLAMRIICKTSADCYIMIGLVHNLWKPLEGRFKDYIAMPKSNGYQSIHTTVLCGTRPLEIQIRTNEMHAVAEHGVASHWLYKKGMNKDTVDIDNLTIINQLRELRKDHLTDTEFFNEIKSELLGDSIFVFTPKGEVRKLPLGATAVDFAYSIHTRIGQTITGAKADGHIIPLSKPLKNTQIIEILTNPQAHPTENQLTQVKTARARSKIRSWLAVNGFTESKEKDTAKNHNDGPRFENAKAIAPGRLQAAAVAEQQTGDTPHAPGTALSAPVAGTGGAHGAEVKIRIGDTANFLASTAKCCNPQYGDAIVGYVSRGRGIIVHRADCSNFRRIENVAQRTISVMWKESAVQSSSAVKPAASKKLRKKKTDCHCPV